MLLLRQAVAGSAPSAVSLQQLSISLMQHAKIDWIAEDNAFEAT
jgi:hypothetical protein